MLICPPFLPPTYQADIALLRLPAPSLRGTFAKAYALLTRLVGQIGWDELLRTRSSVFVMEEEYRKHKTQTSADGGSVGFNTPRAPDTPMGPPADDDASTRGIGRRTPMIDTSANGSAKAKADELEVPQTPIPTIKISSESDHEREHAALAKAGIYPNGVEAPPSPVPEEDELSIEAAADASAAEPPRMKTPDLEKPEVAQAPSSAAQDASEQPASAGANGHSSRPESKLELERNGDDEETSGSFSNKRLCERWLDNLFMVLYEVRGA